MASRIMFAAKTIESGFVMDFYHKADDSVLLDLLAAHTNRLTQMLIYGETNKGEYSASKRSVELLQNEIRSRRGFYVRTASSNKTFNQSSAGGIIANASRHQPSHK